MAFAFAQIAWWMPTLWARGSITRRLKTTNTKDAQPGPTRARTDDALLRRSS